MFKFISAIRLLGLAGAAAFFAITPQAQAEQPIRLIVGYAAGGGVDTAARIVAQKMQQTLGRTVIVENRPGAGGVVAASALTSSAPDGLTLLMTESAFLVAPHIYKNAKFSIQKNFEPVGMVGKIHLGLVGSPRLPASTPAELIELLRKSHGRYSYGTPGVGTLQHLGGEAFKSAARIDMTHVPYRGGAQVINDLMSGGIELGVASLPSAMSQVKAGKVRIIAVMSPKRLPSLPSVPALSETLPEVSVVPSLFILAPMGTPPAAVTRLNQALRVALLDRDTVKSFDAQGIASKGSSPAELAAWMRDEEVRWTELAKKEKMIPLD